MSFVTRFPASKRFAAAVAATLMCLTVGWTTAASPAKAQLLCPDVHIIFARGTLDPGIVGIPFVNALKLRLIGKNVTNYNVNYAADVLQLSAGSGATDMTRNFNQLALRCANTKFVLGGYSQGATVTDIAIGIRTVLGRGESINPLMAGRVAAVVVFGNPLKLTGGDINRDALLYIGKNMDICNLGDPVCDLLGFNVLAHMTYGFDGATNRGADFAAQRVNSLF
jgi:cutinase